jgi:phosphopantothenoylcysteine synthetase/decarboxylase
MAFAGYLVGFAAETENVLANAKSKYERKGCDLLVANDVSRPDIGFDQSENEVTLLFGDGRQVPIAKATKHSIAAIILDHIADALSTS